jgi:3-deoxy-D-manno-octulosonate 8-phosphate phosphatase (KDO 8-P phosphatase)
MNFNNNYNIKLVIMDYDGTLSDGKIYMSPDGNEDRKSCFAHDCHGIKINSNKGIKFAIISGNDLNFFTKRAERLGINDLIGNCDDKITELINLKKKYKIKEDNIAYIGDDINDFNCIFFLKYSASVANAHNIIKKISKFKCTKNGGEGAVREYLDYLFLK